MGKKIDKFRKESRKDSTTSHGELAIPKIVGCPIPEPIECSIGKAVINVDEGVLMECTNHQCPFREQKVHEQCFAEYEDHLIKKLATMGSARGWTEQQRRANLWEKKGQSLIAKSCRCRCGLGTTKRDEMAHYNKTLQEQAAARAAEAAKKKNSKLQKALPQLNFPLQRGPPVKEKRRLNRFDSVCSDTSLDEAYTYHRDRDTASSTDYPANSIISTAPTFADFEDTMSTCSRNDVFSDPQLGDMVPAPLPPPITRSYAAAIKNKSDNFPNFTSPVFSGRDDSGLESKGESPLLSSNAGSKPCSQSSSISENFDEALDITPTRPTRVISQRSMTQGSKSRISIFDDDVVGQLSSEKITSQSLDADVEADTEADDEGYEDGELPLEYILSWCPMTGRGLNLCEFLLANSIFPGLIPKPPVFL